MKRHVHAMYLLGGLIAVMWAVTVFPSEAQALGCRYGYYGTGIGPRGCVACPGGTYAYKRVILLRAGCKVCPPGRIPNRRIAATACNMCPNGTFKPGAWGPCKRCRAGYTSTRDRRGCRPCPKGQYERGGLCHHCPKGTITTKAGQTTCSCPAKGIKLRVNGKIRCIKRCPSGFHFRIYRIKGRNSAVGICVKRKTCPIGHKLSVSKRAGRLFGFCVQKIKCPKEFVIKTVQKNGRLVKACVPIQKCSMGQFFTIMKIKGTFFAVCTFPTKCPSNKKLRTVRHQGRRVTVCAPRCPAGTFYKKLSIVGSKLNVSCARNFSLPHGARCSNNINQCKKGSVCLRYRCVTLHTLPQGAYCTGTTQCKRGLRCIAHKCKRCPVGHSHNAARTKCVLCPKGQYEKDRLCHFCPKGTTTTKVGQTKCVSGCPRGTFQAIINRKVRCIRSCPKGMRLRHLRFRGRVISRCVKARRKHTCRPGHSLQWARFKKHRIRMCAPRCLAPKRLSIQKFVTKYRVRYVAKCVSGCPRGTFQVNVNRKVRCVRSCPPGTRSVGGYVRGRFTRMCVRRRRCRPGLDLRWVNIKGRKVRMCVPRCRAPKKLKVVRQGRRYVAKCM